MAKQRRAASAQGQACRGHNAILWSASADAQTPRIMTSRLCACALALVSCGGVVDPDGSGGAAGTGAGGSSGVGGAGGAAPQLGYDQVIGCASRSYSASVVFWSPLESFFRTSAISGDGRVVAGNYYGAAAVWTAEAGLLALGTENNVLPEELSCDGSVSLLRHPETNAVWHAAPSGAAEIIPESSEAAPLALSPDGEVAVANGAGPRPVRWTQSTGVEALDSLLNTLIYRVSNDSQWLVGADIRQLFRFEPGLGKTATWAWPANLSGFPPETLVSADGSTATIRESPSDSFLVVRDGQAVTVPCPNDYCFPVDISGTGKVVAVYDGYGSWPRTLLFTDRGFKNLQELLEQFGAPLGARTLEVTAMSNDGQAFTGRSYDTETFEERAFYATLPRAAYE